MRQQSGMLPAPYIKLNSPKNCHLNFHICTRIVCHLNIQPISGNTRLHIKQQKRKRNRPTFGGFAGRKLTEAASFWRWHNVLGCQEVWRRSVRDWKFSGKEGARTGGTMEDGKKGKTKECSKLQIVSTTSTAFLLGIYCILKFSGKILKILLQLNTQCFG